MYKYLFFLILVLLTSCNGEKAKLIETYEQLQSVIENGNAQEIYDKLDSKSKEYVDFLTDSSNQDYEVMKTDTQEIEVMSENY